MSKLKTFKFNFSQWAPRPSTRLGTVLGPLARFSARRSDFPYPSHCMLADRVLRTHKAKLVGTNAGVEL